MKKIISLVLVCALCCSLFVTVSAKEIGAYEENSLHFYIREDYALFTGCDDDLSGDVVIPAYVQGYPVAAFDDFALEDADKITSITLPETMIVVYTEGFLGADSLENIYVDENSSDFLSVDGVLYDKESEMLVVYPKGRTGSYTVPAFTESVCTGAFMESKIEEVVFDSQLTKIDDNTFAGCANLKKIVLPDSITYIGESAFYGCSSLKEINIPSKVQSIDVNAFAYCASLENITVSSENEDYKSCDGVLFDSSGYYLVQYPVGNPRDYYAIPGETREICEHAFAGCKNLKTIAFHKDMGKVRSYAFDGCEGLEKVEFDANIFEWNDIAIEHGNDALLEVAPDGGFLYNSLNFGAALIGAPLMWLWMALQGLLMLLAMPFQSLINLFSGQAM